MKDKIVEILKRAFPRYGHIWRLVAEEIAKLYSAGEEMFPTWREAMDGITDSRIKGDFDDMNIYQSGARIMYDRLYSMLHDKLTRPVVTEEKKMFTISDIEHLQSSVHKLTGDGKVMQLFNELLGIKSSH